MGPLGIGVIGTGFAASAHVDAMRRIAGARLIAVAASSAEKADSAARRFGADRAYGDYRALLEDDAVDVVHDCTPNDLHAAVNTAALEAGKHLLSEKPLALDASETGSLARQAATAGVVAGVCFNYRYFPLVRQLRAMLSSGDYGRPHLVRGVYLQDWLLEETDWNWRLEAARAGTSRAVGDIGSHWIDLAQHVTGDEIVAVCAVVGRLHDERIRPANSAETFVRTGGGEGERVAVDTEDFATVLVRFASGLPGMFAVSQVTAGRKNRLVLEVDTARASFAWNQEKPDELWIGRRDAPNAQLVRDPALLEPTAAALAHYPGGHQEGWADALRNLLLDFYAAVHARREGRDHQASFTTFAGAHATTTLVGAVLESARAGGWVEVEGQSSSSNAAPTLRAPHTRSSASFPG